MLRPKWGAGSSLLPSAPRSGRQREGRNANTTENKRGAGPPNGTWPDNGVSLGDENTWATRPGHDVEETSVQIDEWEKLIWQGYTSHDSNYMRFWKRQNYADSKRIGDSKEQICGCQRGRGQGRDRVEFEMSRGKLSHKDKQQGSVQHGEEYSKSWDKP